MINMKKAFTMAEVLITIAILGVVAAMTLPALRSDVDKKTWETGLQTTQSVVNSGFAQMLALENAEVLDETELWASVITADVTKENSNVKKQLDLYFKIDKTADGSPVKVYDTGLKASTALAKTWRIYLPNTATLNMALHKASGINGNYADIYVDVNGDKKPNTFGKDIYKFHLSGNGKLVQDTLK